MAKTTPITINHLIGMSKQEKDALRKQLYLLVDELVDGSPAAFSSGSIGYRVNSTNVGLVAGGEHGKVWCEFKAVVVGSKDPTIAAEQKERRKAERSALEDAGLRQPRA